MTRAGNGELLKACLAKALSIYRSEPLVDQRRVTRPSGGNTHSINIEPYRGSYTSIAISKKLEQEPLLDELDQFLKDHDPALLGYVFSPQLRQRRHIRFTSSLITHLAWSASRLIDQGLVESDAIEATIRSIEDLRSSRKAILEVFSPLRGLSLPDALDSVDLGRNVVIRRLTENEIVDLTSEDILLRQGPFEPFEPLVSCALVVTTEVEFDLREGPIDDPIVDPAQDTCRELADAFLLALHALKAGQTSVAFTTERLLPTVLPGMEGGRSWPFRQHRFERLELSEADVARLPAVFLAIVDHPRAEFKVALARLRDAENRMSPADALLDAIIGLEVLLNPLEHGEQAFRLALNYAHLGDQSKRRERYQQMKDVQGTRNRIVHRGLSIHSKDGGAIHKHAQLAKSCLREALEVFMSDPVLKSTKRLDAEYWIDRIIPPHSIPRTET